MTNEIQVPDWKLERYILSELPLSDMETVRKAVESDSSVGKRLEQLRQSNVDILNRYPSEWTVKQIRGRARSAVCAERTSTPLIGHIGMIPRLAAVLLVLLAVLLPLYESHLDRNRLKGNGPFLVLYRKIPSGSERLTDDSIAREGDTIQIAYNGYDRQFGIILSLDARGVITLHLPEQGSQAVKLGKGRLVPLQSAFQLDDAPGWESFYFVTSERPFALEPILQAIRKVSGAEKAPEHLPIPESFAQFAFVLRKAVKP